MKKLLVLLLALVMVFSLVGCGAKEEPTTGNDKEQSNNEDTTKENGLQPEEGSKLLVWESEDINGEWLQEVAKKFE